MPGMKKKALVLAGGLPQIEFIKELKSRGYYVILADYYPNPIAKPYADFFYQESTLDIEAIRKIVFDEKIDMITTCCTDQALDTVARLSQEFGLPCYIGADTGLAVTNKQIMKQRFYEHGIPTAKFQWVNSVEDMVDLNYPLVVKPADCNSSKGVRKAKNDAEYREALKVALELSRTHKAIVEEYIQGTEISVDLFVTDKKAKLLCCSVSDKIKEDGKFVIYKTTYPAPISGETQAKILEVAQQIVDVFKLDYCPMLIQFLKRGEDLYVIEFSARTGGCVKYRLIALTSGVDIMKVTADAFEGKPIQLHPFVSNQTVVNEFLYCKKGTFAFLKGAEECVNEGLLSEYYVLKSPGELFEKVENSGDRVAALTYVSDSYDDYVWKHNQVIQKISVIDMEGQDMMRHDLLPAI